MNNNTFHNICMLKKDNNVRICCLFKINKTKFYINKSRYLFNLTLTGLSINNLSNNCCL